MAFDEGESPAELRQLDDEELTGKLREAKEELFNLRVQGATGQLDNNRRLAQVRRQIARIYTVLRERELGLAPVLVAEEPDTEVADDAAEEKETEEVAS